MSGLASSAAPARLRQRSDDVISNTELGYIDADLSDDA
jgi:hypothetical protein